MRRLCAAAVLLAAATQAWADDTHRLYGPNGQSLGSFTTTGNTTVFYGPRGERTGSATVTGGTTTFYGPDGQVKGHSYGRSR